MTATMGGEALAYVLRGTILALVRRDDVDLTSRQLGVFLTVYLTAGPHTVRGLAAELNVSKPAITRALDRLGELSLVQRKVDPMDRRSVLVQQTRAGDAFLAGLPRSWRQQARNISPRRREHPRRDTGYARRR